MDVSAREADVLAALAGDRSNAQVARRLGISVRTVESHVSALLRKLDVPDRRALARLAGAGGFAGLPAPTTTFVGRERDLAEVRRALGSNRLVSLLGPGGVGKTRLAVAVAGAVAGDYAAGGAFVDLVPVGAGFVQAATAAALGVADRPPQPLADTLLDRLRLGRTLLVLDNCEHLVDEVSVLVARVLERAPDTTVLVTSRERLGVAGERPVLVAPLPLGSDAERLFVDRAALDATPDEVAALCAGLDGMPLAIELAAARAGSLGMAGLTAGLADRLRLLAGSRGVDQRHSSLRSVIGWSHELLDDAERTLFCRLSVFAGGFDLAAAAFVGDVPLGEAADLLGRLTDKSLLRRGGDRWHMLATVRAFAAEQLTDEVRARHLLWAADLATALVARLDDQWRPTFDAVDDDLRAALAVDDNPGTAPPAGGGLAVGGGPGHRLARGLARLTFARGRFVEACGHYETAASRAADAATAYRDLRDGADAALVVADGGEAYRLLRVAAARAEAEGDEATRLAADGYTVVVVNRYDMVGADTPTAYSGHPAARAWAHRHDVDLARAAVESAGGVVDRLCALDVLGLATAAAGRLREAYRIAEDRLALAHTLPWHEPGAVTEVVDAFHVASTTAVAVGNLPAALALARRAPADDPVAGHPYVAAPRQVRVLTLAGRLDEAARWATTMWEGWRAAGCPPAEWMSTAVAAAALAHGLRGDGQFAVWRARAVEVARSADSPSLTACAAFVDARFALHTDDFTEAAGLVARAFAPFAEPWWQPYAHAAGAELAVTAALPDAERFLAAAAQAASENDWAAATLTRARARLTRDEALVADAADQWARIDARFERARTLDLLPGRTGSVSAHDRELAPEGRDDDAER
ncbi:putative ATPase [Actinophytocola oryzae]|uniref:Putative ATPase n=2 Tax=Actinophytocola oryzae TaxID=502181 RepID=A0A4R7W5H7_9PSEU|nr:putative ATPase [Actinophytocola oryzae]